MKTKLPFSIFFSLAITAALLPLYFGISIGRIFVYELLTLSLLYLIFSRFACRMMLTEDALHVKYLFPWNKDIKIQVASIQKVEIKKGFYDLFSDDTIAGLFVFPRFCYDQLILEIYADGKVDTAIISVNTRFSQFDRIVKLIKKRLKGIEK